MLPLSFLPIFLLSLSGSFLVADGALTASAPSTVQQCNPTTFSWQGGAAPFTILFKTTNDLPRDTPIRGQQPTNVTVLLGLQFGNIQDFSYKTAIYFLRGSQVSFQVTDSQNQTSNEVSFSVVGGDTAACEVRFHPGTAILAPGETDDPDLTIDPPDVEADACDEFFFVHWGITGTPPYIMSAQTRGLAVQQSTIFANLSGGIPNIQIPFPSGVQVVFGVQDIVGRQSFTTPITIQPYVVPSNSCVISNLTKADPSVTSLLPFPSFYALGAPTTTSATFPTPRTTNGAVPTLSAHLSGPEGPDPADLGPDVGLIAGLIIGIPGGIFFLSGLLAMFLAARRQQQRKEMVRPYWEAKSAVDAHVLSPRGERYATTPFSG